MAAKNRALVAVGALGLVGIGVAVAASRASASAPTKKKTLPEPAPEPDAAPPFVEAPPARPPAPPPDVEEPSAPAPRPPPSPSVSPPMTRAPEPEEEDEEELEAPGPVPAPPPRVQPTAKVVAVRPSTAAERAAMEPSVTLTVDSPTIRTATPAEVKQAAAAPKAAPKSAAAPKAAAAPKPLPAPPPEPTAADYAKMHQEASERAKTAPTLPAPKPTPPATLDRAKARQLATKVAANVDAKRFDYSRPLVREFQLAAGLSVDGAYGPATKAAVQYYGVRRPPKALFKGADGTLKDVPYRWSEN